MKSFFRALLIIVTLILAGCAGAPVIETPVAKKLPSVPGIYHRVEKGQTLWRISKMYECELQELARINHISDTSNIEIGQLIFIPNRTKPRVIASTNTEEDFIWPVKGEIISHFGQSSGKAINKGIDIRPTTSDAVVAARSGKVIFCGSNFGGYGKTLIIEHADGLKSVYSRNAQVLVKAGEHVSRGVKIAQAGSSGRDRRVFLHFEIRKGHIPQNPNFYLPR